MTTKRQRRGWEKVRRQWPGIWRHTSGWTVKHCGHPTAIWPYYAVSPQGDMVIAPNGYAFRQLKLAQEAVETIVHGAGTYKPVNGFNLFVGFNPAVE